MADRKAFFYARWMAPQVLYRVIFGTIKPIPEQTARLTISPALLHRFVRRRVYRCDYPAITPSSEPESSVRGTYVCGLTAEDQRRLDLFEGDQYDRIRVHPRLLDHKGNETVVVDAETYVWRDANVGLEKGEWDFDEFQRAKMGRWIGQDDEYEDVDKAMKAAQDPTGGRGLNGHITERLEQKIQSDDAVLEAAV